MSEPSRYVEPEITDARVERLWHGVAERLEPRPARRFVLAGAFGVVLAAAGGWLWLGAERREPAVPRVASAIQADAKLQTASDELSVTLSDGSSLGLAKQSEVEVRGSKSARVSLALARGAVTCDVTHRDGRSFQVSAGDVEVRVVGTKFSVKSDGGELPRVEVSVERGVVEVVSRRRPGVVARVGAGQSWIQSAEPAARVEAAPPTLVPPAPVGSAKAPASAATLDAPVGPSARELFEKAGEHRRAGDAAAAARGYEELLRKYPADARASLALFELGRLRMDRLGDRAGAVAALERALSSNLGPSFREDALARLVSAYAAQGNFAACSRTRDRYLAAYPAGVHASAVAIRCGAR